MSATDRELLELAAKAAGIVVKYWDLDHSAFWADTRLGDWWNPLTDDGDALRLAVKLGLNIIQQRTFAGPEPVAAACGFCADDMRLTSTNYEGNPPEATRRAIVLAAAEIGRQLP